MKYRRLETLIMALGLGVILASIIVSYNPKNLSEILGQALRGPVLFFALHYGRRVGFLSAILAAILYLISKFPNQGTISISDLTTQLVLLRAGIFGLVGIIGGEVAVRLKYLLIKLGDGGLIDPITGVYSYPYLVRLFQSYLGQYERYRRIFSVIIIKLNQVEILGAPEKKVLKETGELIRNNIRLIDDLGYHSQGTFCLLLPGTIHTEAESVAKRLQSLLIKHFRSQQRENKTEALCFTFPKDREKIYSLFSSELESKEEIKSPEAVSVT